MTVPMKMKFVIIIMKMRCFRKCRIGDIGSCVVQEWRLGIFWRNFRKGIINVRNRAAEMRISIGVISSKKIVKR